MKVHELISALREFDRNSEVYTCESDRSFCSLTGNILDKDGASAASGPDSPGTIFLEAFFEGQFDVSC